MSPSRPHRVRLLGATTLSVVALLGASLFASAPATATATAMTAEDGTPAPDRPVMPVFDAQSYVGEAAELPTELRAAIESDLGETAEQYLAGADAAAAAVDVVAGLEASGVTVATSRLEGTTLVVTVESDTDAAAVEAVGATPELGSAPGPEDRRHAAVADNAVGSLEPLDGDPIVGGQGYVFGTAGAIYACSVAFNGLNSQYGRDAFLTAGHCQTPGDEGILFELEQSKPDDPRARIGDMLGERLPGTFSFGNELDSGVVHLDDFQSALPEVGTWNSGANNGPPSAGNSVRMRDYGDAIVGQSLCKSGSTTGWSCGKVTYVDQLLEIGEGGPQVNLDIVKGMCSRPGDSGGAVLSGPYAMGVLSAGSTTGSCTASGLTAVFPMVAPKVDGEQYGSVRSSQPGWELQVPVPDPYVEFPEPSEVLKWGERIRGTVEGGSPNFSVTVVIDSDFAKRTYTVPVSADGSWSVLPTGITDGRHTCVVYVTFGTQRGGGQDCRFTSEGAPEVERIAGADRFEVAVNISKTAFPATAPVVYVATGLGYPDALSAGPAAVVEGGPLLLVRQNEIPAGVVAEIQRLKPSRIVIAGGPNSVSTGVAATLKTLVAGVSVERRSGADRYEASQSIVSGAFETAAHAYTATGTNFPDALSAGGAAGSALEPVVLVNGSLPSVGAATLDLFRSLESSSITVVGGPNSVSEGAAASLSSVPASVDRVAAGDRYQTSIALNRSAFESSDTVYLATGLNFPDALAGGVLAGLGKAPLYVVPTDCVPTGVLDDIASLEASTVVLLGGPNSLSPAVASLTACAV